MKASDFNTIRTKLQAAIENMESASVYMFDGDGTWLELSERLEAVVRDALEILEDVNAVPLCG